MKLKYHNVGCIKDAEVEYKPGQLVAIIGESNQGKSLQFYSLLSGFTNSADFKRFINIDELAKNPKAGEQIILTDDTGVQWEVGATNSSLYYRIGNVKYDKTHRKSIFEIAQSQIPGLLYDPDNCTPIMNIVDEDTGMFPIDRSDAQIFKTYERLLRLSCTEDILKTIKLDMEDIDYQISSRTDAMQKNQVSLQKLIEFNKSIDTNELSNMLKKLEVYVDTIKNIENYNNQANDSMKYIKATEELCRIPVSFSTSLFKEALEILITMNKIDNYCKLVNSVNDIHIGFDLDRSIELFSNCSKAVSLSAEITSLETAIAKDECLLKTIENNLSTIDVCPLCGKPM